MSIVGSPFTEYEMFWRIFRSMSNENEVFSDSILNCDLFTNSPQTIVIDVGTGDGEITYRIINETEHKQFILIDPSEAYLSIAKVLTMKYKKRVMTHEVKFLDMDPHPIALYLAVHMIYLLTEEEIELLINLPNFGSDLILIVDSPYSIFSELWQLCAKDYYKKIELFYEKLQRYKNKKVTPIESKVISPFKPRIDYNIRTAMLSIMCYSDWKLLPKSSKEQAKQIIQKHIKNDTIMCNSNLIEIPNNI